MLLCFQVEISTFQLILATDGNASFAIFHFEYPEILSDLNITLPQDVMGFSTGVNRTNISTTSFTDLEELSVFRIDGNYYFQF